MELIGSRNGLVLNPLSPCYRQLEDTESSAISLFIRRLGIGSDVLDSIPIQIQNGK